MADLERLRGPLWRAVARHNGRFGEVLHQGVRHVDAEASTPRSDQKRRVARKSARTSSCSQFGSFGSFGSFGNTRTPRPSWTAGAYACSLVGQQLRMDQTGVQS